METISNCFRHCGIGVVDDAVDLLANHQVRESLDELATVAAQLNVQDTTELDNALDVDYHVDAYDNAEIDIDEQVLAPLEADEDSSAASSDDSDFEELPPRRTKAEIEECLRILEDFNVYLEEGDILPEIDKIRQMINYRSKSQSKITDYFKNQ